MKITLCSVLFVLCILSYFSCYEDTDDSTVSVVSSVVSYQHWTAKDAGNLRAEGFFPFLTAMSTNLYSSILKSSLLLIVAQEIPLGKGNHLQFYLFTERQACDHKAKLCASKWQVQIALISSPPYSPARSPALGWLWHMRCPPALGRSWEVTHPSVKTTHVSPGCYKMGL